MAGRHVYVDVTGRDPSGYIGRIAAPLIGGIFSSFLLELVVYPAVYEVWKSKFPVRIRSRAIRARRRLERATRESVRHHTQA